MRATAEFLNESLILTFFGNEGNPARVIIGGNDGILVTIDGNGKIVIVPPEGPGDPELLTAFKSVFNGLQVAGGIFMPCVVIEGEITKVQGQIDGSFPRPVGVTVAQLDQQLRTLNEKYREEGCA
jgi:hypothetical protein